MIVFIRGFIVINCMEEELIQLEKTEEETKDNNSALENKVKKIKIAVLGFCNGNFDESAVRTFISRALDQIQIKEGYDKQYTLCYVNSKTNKINKGRIDDNFIAVPAIANSLAKVKKWTPEIIERDSSAGGPKARIRYTIDNIVDYISREENKVDYIVRAKMIRGKGSLEGYISAFAEKHGADHVYQTEFEWTSGIA